MIVFYAFDFLQISPLSFKTTTVMNNYSEISELLKIAVINWSHGKLKNMTLNTVHTPA